MLRVFRIIKTNKMKFRKSIIKIVMYTQRFNLIHANTVTATSNSKVNKLRNNMEYLIIKNVNTIKEDVSQSVRNVNCSLRAEFATMKPTLILKIKILCIK